MNGMTKKEILDALRFDHGENSDAPRHTRPGTNPDAPRSRSSSKLAALYAGWPEESGEEEDSGKDAVDYRYMEDSILAEIRNHIDSTYVSDDHYVCVSEESDKKMQCFDALMSLGDASTTFRDTSITYLWRYGKKGGKNRKDILKAIHYLVMLLYVDRHAD
jgi:hypothetical protein